MLHTGIRGKVPRLDHNHGIRALIASEFGTFLQINASVRHVGTLFFQNTMAGAEQARKPQDHGGRLNTLLVMCDNVQARRLAGRLLFEPIRVLLLLLALC